MSDETLKGPLATLAILLALGLTGCDADNVIAPSRALTLEVAISDASIDSGETATVTYTVRNVTAVSLTVTTGCNLLPYIKDANGAFVVPDRGAWICSLIARPPITLAPGEAISGSLPVSGRGTSTSGVSTKLPAGRYSAYVEYMALLVDFRKSVQLRSRDVPFEITE